MFVGYYLIETHSTKDSTEIWKKIQLLMEKQLLGLQINQKYMYYTNY